MEARVLQQNSTDPGATTRGESTYGAAGKWLHWIVAALVSVQYVIAILMPGFGPKTVPGTLINLHLSFGVLIFIVVVTLFGFVSLPALVPAHARVGLVGGDVHTIMMWAMLALIGLHAAAALFHHFVRHDGTLLRMLPSSATH